MRIESNNINCLTNYEDTKENKKTKESKETKTKDCSKKINNIQRDNNLKIIYANAEELAAHEQYLTKLKLENETNCVQLSTSTIGSSR